jgi:hypothetical protein
VRAAIAGLVAAWLALGGCGGDDEAATTAPPTGVPAGEPQSLTASQRKLVERSETAIRDYCVRFAAAALRERPSPTRAAQVRATDALGRLIALARRKPAADLGAGADLRLFLGDLAEDFEGLNCDPRLLARLERGLAALPRR